jgi:hypothetical protein
MNKEIIHQASQVYAEQSFIQPMNARGEVMSMPAGHTVPYGYRKHCKIAERHFKAGVAWYQQQQLKPAEKPVMKKDVKFWLQVNCWPFKQK